MDLQNKELKLINAVCKNKDISTLYSKNIEDMFMNYRDVWGSIKNYHAKYQSVPSISVLKESHPDLKELDIDGQTEYYLDALTDAFIKKRLDDVMTGVAEGFKSGEAGVKLLAKLQATTSGITRLAGNAIDTNIMDIDEAVKHYQQVRENFENGVGSLNFGIDTIDAHLPAGMQPGDMIVVFGHTGRKKSFFTSLLACNVHEKGYTPMIVSMEMSAEKVRDRVWTIKGSGLFSNRDLTMGHYHEDSMVTFQDKYKNTNEFIVVTSDEAEVTPLTIEAKIDQHKPDLLILDYAQLLSDMAGSTDMVSRMRNLSKEIKRLAVRKKIPIILISSSTPESGAAVTGPPEMNQVAYSRQIAFDADLAIAVHGENESDIIRVVARKSRNSGLFAVDLDWDVDSGIITEIHN